LEIYKYYYILIYTKRRARKFKS